MNEDAKKVVAKETAVWPYGRPDAGKLAERLCEWGVRSGSSVLANAILDDPLGFIRELGNLHFWSDLKLTFDVSGRYYTVETKGDYFYVPVLTPHIHDYVVRSVRPTGPSLSRLRVTEICQRNSAIENMEPCSLIERVIYVAARDLSYTDPDDE